jgi:hypothetical protein
MLNKISFCIVWLCFIHSNASSQCFMNSLSATVSSCLAAPNLGSYEVTGTIKTTNPPASGTLTVTGNGVSTTFSPPFSSTINYTLPARAGQGGSFWVVASYSGILCFNLKYVTAPQCCNITVTPTTVSVCESQLLTLNASGTSGGTYFWSGPGGFSSNQQNPIISNILATQAGTYQVYLQYGSCTTATEQVNVTVKSKPIQKDIIHQ